MDGRPTLPIEELTGFRQTLHHHPEVSGEEFSTSKRVVDFIEKFQPSRVVTEIGGTGLAAIFDSGEEGPVVMFRAELDALPIEEVNHFDYRSAESQVSHKCGHDGHMAILAGLAAQLNQKQPKKGKVILLFQPAEETGAGARAVMADEKFSELKPDYVFALHNLPGYVRHHIVCRPGSFTASVTTMIIRLKGKTSHAAEPEHGINPAQAISEIINVAIDLENRDEKSDDFSLITPIRINMGEAAFGTSAGHGELTFTLRAFNDSTRQKLSDDFSEKVKRIAHDKRLGVDISWEQSFSATDNDQEMVKLVEQAAKKCGLTYVQKEGPFRWGEDFGLFTASHQGAMFGLGAGTSAPALHNPDYDFPDDLIPTGARVFLVIAEQLLA